MDSNIYLVGLNHRTAGVDVRERLALDDCCDPERWAVPCVGAIQESLILSTCNRVELLAAGKGDITEQMLQCWARARDASITNIRPYIYIHKNLEAVRHIFFVASSLDSMVLGEPQILGQLKAAYRKAAACRTTGVILNRLLYKSFSVAKRVRTETAIAANAVSISYAAVELARRIFGDMRRHKVLLVGAGKMAELAATHLLQNGVDEILVANRTVACGEELAKQFHGRAVPLERLTDFLPSVDIIITSTGSPRPVIRAKDISAVLKTRKNSPMFFIDIAVPRDIDPDVNSLDNVYLYDIDDLKEVVEENLDNRRDEANRAREIVDEEVADFAGWLDMLDVQPTLVELLGRGERMAGKEVARTLKRLGSRDENLRETLETMAKSLVHKLHHGPIMFLKHGDKHEEGNNTRISAVRKIFNLDSDS